jgi:nucleotide-binding universal stress UspA family protein
VDTLVVPLDGSDFSLAAVPVAARLASKLDAALHLLSAVHGVPDADARAEWLAAVDVPGKRVTRSVVIATDVSTAVHEVLQGLERSMVCMATHGRSRSAAIVGSVAAAVVDRNLGPLVLVCPYMEQAKEGRGVVACVDDTPPSEVLVRLALHWSELLHEPPTVLTVAEDVPADGESVRRRFGASDIEALLRELVAPERTGGRPVATVAWYDPIAVWSGVHDYLRDRPAALVLVARRHRSALSRFVHGDTAASIVRHSPSPVLVVPDAGE